MRTVRKSPVFVQKSDHLSTNGQSILSGFSASFMLIKVVPNIVFIISSSRVKNNIAHRFHGAHVWTEILLTTLKRRVEKFHQIPDHVNDRTTGKKRAERKYGWVSECSTPIKSPECLSWRRSLMVKTWAYCGHFQPSRVFPLSFISNSRSHGTPFCFWYSPETHRFWSVWSVHLQGTNFIHSLPQGFPNNRTLLHHTARCDALQTISMSFSHHTRSLFIVSPLLFSLSVFSSFTAWGLLEKNTILKFTYECLNRNKSCDNCLTRTKNFDDENHKYWDVRSLCPDLVRSWGP